MEKTATSFPELLRATARAVIERPWPLTPEMRKAVDRGFLLVLPIVGLLSFLSAWIGWELSPDTAPHGTMYEEFVFFIYSGYTHAANGFLVLGLSTLAIIFHAVGPDGERTRPGNAFWSDLVVCIVLLLLVQLSVGRLLNEPFSEANWLWQEDSHTYRERLWLMLADNVLKGFEFLIPFAMAHVLLMRTYRVPLRGWRRFALGLATTLIGALVLEAVLWAAFGFLDASVLLVIKVLFHGNIMGFVFVLPLVYLVLRVAVPAYMIILWEPLRMLHPKDDGGGPTDPGALPNQATDTP